MMADNEVIADQVEIGMNIFANIDHVCKVEEDDKWNNIAMEDHNHADADPDTGDEDDQLYHGDKLTK